MPQIGCLPLRLPLDHDSFAPFVRATFVNEVNQEITSVTVGNESYKSRPNTAVIKSMEYGYMDKPEAVLEIIDEAGGELGLFVAAIRKCGTLTVNPGARLLLKFGWVKADCEGYSSDNMITFEGFVELIIEQIDISYERGLVKYRITAHPMDVITTNEREPVVQGRSSPDGPKMRLTTAIERLCATKKIIVVYASEQGDGILRTKMGTWPEGMSAAEAPWEWNVGGIDGPRGSWQGDNNDVLSTISRWLGPYRTKRGVEGGGIKMVFDSKRFDMLFLWEDPGPKNIRCSEIIGGTSKIAANKLKGDGEDRGYLGTFIVNGGKCSPVISFEPKFNFLSGLARESTGGNAAGAENTKGERAKEMPNDKKFVCVNDKRSGPENNATIPQHSKENYPPSLVHKENLRSELAHIKANMLTEFQIADLQANMTIMGIPTDKFVDMKQFLHAPVSVIVINPFFVAGGQNQGCGDWSWLASSGCNQMLSDQRYICTGVNHSIREGSYTTTLKLVNFEKVNIQVS